jgi:hypothetical protein
MTQEDKDAFKLLALDFTLQIAGYAFLATFGGLIFGYIAIGYGLILLVLVPIIAFIYDY